MFCISDIHGPWILWCWAVNKQLHSCSDSGHRSKESLMSGKGDISLSLALSLSLSELGLFLKPCKHWGTAKVLCQSSGVSFITVAYAQNEAWNVRTPLLTQTLGFIKTNLTGKFAYFHANSDPCVRTFWRRESGDAVARWWIEARLLIQFIIYIITNSLVLLARHICLKIYKTSYSKLR